MATQDYSENLNRSIQDALLSQKGKDYLVTNRGLMGSFYHTLADALYDYEKGIILIERFYKKDSCKMSKIPYKYLSDENKERISELRDSIKDVLSKGVDEFEANKERVDKLQESIKDIEPDIAEIDVYSYGNVPLVRFDLYDTDAIETLSTIYTGFCLSATLTLSGNNLAHYEALMSTIECDDYIDLVLIPGIKKSS